MRKIICIFLATVLIVAGCPTLYAGMVTGAMRGIRTGSTQTTYFNDVPLNAWYKYSVDYCVSKGYFSGTGLNQFTPGAALTREQLVKVLFNFADYDSWIKHWHQYKEELNENAWYFEAISWATDLGIISGIEGRKFGLGSNVTREQVCTILMNYATSLGINTSCNTDIYRYTDAYQVSDWAVSAVSWAVNSGIVTGTSATTLSPKGITTRAQATVLFMKLENYLNKKVTCRHKYNYYLLDSASCTENGSINCICKKCNYSRICTLPQKGHFIINGYCQYCKRFFETPSPVGQFILDSKIGPDYSMFQGKDAHQDACNLNISLNFYSDGGFCVRYYDETYWGSWSINYLDAKNGKAYLNVYMNGYQSIIGYRINTDLMFIHEEEYICNVRGQHPFDEWTVTTSATTTKAGEKTRECSLCHKVETVQIPKIEVPRTNSVTQSSNSSSNKKSGSGSSSNNNNNSNRSSSSNSNSNSNSSSSSSNNRSSSSSGSSTVPRRCFNCSGSGYANCSLCHGSGTSISGRFGIGAYVGRTTCSYCSGTGKIICAGCRGTGYLN